MNFFSSFYIILMGVIFKHIHIVPFEWLDSENTCHLCLSVVSNYSLLLFTHCRFNQSIQSVVSNYSPCCCLRTAGLSSLSSLLIIMMWGLMSSWFRGQSAVCAFPVLPTRFNAQPREFPPGFSTELPREVMLSRGGRASVSAAAVLLSHRRSDRGNSHWPIDDPRKSRGLHSVSAYRHGLYIYTGPCLRV